MGIPVATGKLFDGEEGSLKKLLQSEREARGDTEA
jgi:hypothetical protein